jgi:hypothetical protein
VARIQPDPPSAISLTDEQIACAMTRAVALRRQSASHAATVTAHPRRADDAIRATETWRFHTRWQRLARGDRSERTPWVWIGWVSVETTPWGFARFDRERYAEAWEVWLNVDDGRVWLRWERHGRFADDPYP